VAKSNPQPRVIKVTSFFMNVVFSKSLGIY
jgi:hypothetical protein